MTAPCETCHELLGGYVLGALDADEDAVVREHLALCPACAREHEDLAGIPVLLDLGGSADAEPLRPPARLEEAVLDQFARERRGVVPPGNRRRAGARRRPPRWLVPAACALACALTVVAVVVSVTREDRQSAIHPPGNAESTSPSRPPVYEVALKPSGALAGATGDARLYPGASGTGVHLRVSGLDPRRYDYELWCVRDDGWKVSAGTFRVDGSGNADVHLSTSAVPTEYDSLAIQARPAGTGAATTGPRVLAGRIRA
jgi:anti-sigma factor RsiW